MMRLKRGLPWDLGTSRCIDDWLGYPLIGERHNEDRLGEG